MLAALLLLAACEKTEPDENVGTSCTKLRITTAPLTIVGEQVPYDTRASQPLYPEEENIIYSLAVLVFDESEGVLHKFEATGKHYKYINLKDENGNGELSTTLSVEDFPIQPNEEYTVCLIANLSEEKIEEIINGMMEDGTVFIHEFKEVSVAIPYVDSDLDEHLEIGHVREIYMFGYYQGEVSSHKEISITLGRIISRLEIAFTIDKEILEEDKTFYMRMNNLESYAHLFPIGKSPGLYAPTGIARVSSLENMKHTIYFYSAPNGALTEEKALNFEVWYGDKNLKDPALIEESHSGYAKIYLCNDQPEVQNRNYQLNRNSVYRFNINLTAK